MLSLFCRKEIGMHKNTWPLTNGRKILCSPTFLGAQKGMTPTPFAPAHPRSLNTPHQRHYSSYLLISAFLGGIVKDREALFSLNYVHLKNFWGLMLLLVVLYLQVLWNLILVVIYTTPIVRFYLNAIAFKCFLVRMIKNQFHSSSWFFYVCGWI